MKILLFIAIIAILFGANTFGMHSLYTQELTNFSYDRNDISLLEKNSCKKPRSWREEELVLKTLIANENIIDNPVVLFVGGFHDCAKAYLYRVIPEFKKRLQEQDINADIFYREHDELHGIKDLFALYHKKGKNIIIVAHSWGACSVFKAFWKDTRVPIDLIVSLDPVGLVRPSGEASHIKKWINIAVDYTKAPYTFSNTIARIGQPFGVRENATLNIITNHNHQQANKMFFDYAYNEVMNYITK